MPSYVPGTVGTPQGFGGNGGTVAAGTAAADSGLTVNQKRFYTGVFIERLLPELTYLSNDGEKSTIPANTGGFTTNSIRFMVQGTALPLATTALLEGAAPTPNTLDWREIGTRLAQYGGIATHTDILKHAGLSNIVTMISEELGTQAGRTLHSLMMNIILGGTNVLYGGGAATRAGLTSSTTHKLAAALIKRAARDLARKGVPRFPDGFYHAVLSMDQVYDLQDDPAWQALNGYYFAPSTVTGGSKDGSTAFDAGGTLFGVKITASPHNTVINRGTGLNSPNTGDALADAAIDVHQGVVYGPKAFGFFDHESFRIPNLDRRTGRGVRMYMVPADQETKDDPLGQVGVMGWKVAFGGLVLDQRRIVRLETSTTLNTQLLDYGSNAGVGTLL